MPGEDAGLKEHMLKSAAEAGVEAPHKSVLDAEPPAETPPETPPEEQNKADAPPESKTPSAVESIAKEWGHVSKEEFEADPRNTGKQWVDAETFIRNMKPISDSYRNRDRESHQRLEELTKVTKQLLAKQEAADQRVAEAEKRAKERLIEELNFKLDEATDAQDKEAVRDLAKKIAALHGEIAAPAVTPKTEEATQTPPNDDEGFVPAAKSPTVARWMGRNERTADNPHGWYGDREDPINILLTNYADTRSAALGQQGFTWKEIFETMEPEIAAERAKYQAKYAAPKPKPSSSSAGGGSPAAPGGVSVDSLTDAERKAGLRFVKDGLFKNLTEYAKALKSA